MTAVALTLAVGLLGAIGAIVWLAHRGDKRTDRILAGADVLATTRTELGAQTVRAERADFELKSATSALAVERARVFALEDYVATQAIDTDPNADLADDDVAGRLLRLSRKLGGAAAEAHPRGSVHREAEPAVRDEVAPAGPGPDDLLRPE